MKHIIAATDFSDNANNAASFAADLACRLRAHLNLLYVFPTAVPFADGSMPPLYIEDAQEEGERQLAELKERLLLQTGEKIIVGVNKFQVQQEQSIPAFKIDDSIREYEI